MGVCPTRPGSLLCRQELEEHCLQKVCQTWEERSEEENLTLQQEEGEGRPGQGSPFEGQADLSPWVYRPGAGEGVAAVPVPASALH